MQILLMFFIVLGLIASIDETSLNQSQVAVSQGQIIASQLALYTNLAVKQCSPAGTCASGVIPVVIPPALQPKLSYAGSFQAGTDGTSMVVGIYKPPTSWTSVNGDPLHLFGQVAVALQDQSRNSPYYGAYVLSSQTISAGRVGPSQGCYPADTGYTSNCGMTTMGTPTAVSVPSSFGGLSIQDHEPIAAVLLH